MKWQTSFSLKTYFKMQSAAVVIGTQKLGGGVEGVEGVGG